MAIAGKVSIVPRGEWQSTAVYTRLDLVTFNRNAYLSLKNSTGIQPTNTEYWMLLIENVANTEIEALQTQIDDIVEDIADIINGTTPVGDSKRLGGLTKEEWQSKIENIIVVPSTTVYDFDTLLETKTYAFNNASLSIALNAPPIKVGGFLTVTKGGGYTKHVYQSNNNVVLYRAYNGATWSPWSNDAKTLNGLTAQEFVNNGNMLINTDFSNPVNSSGKTEWTGVTETIDGWKTNNANDVVELKEFGLAITLQETSFFRQSVNLKAGTYTMSVDLYSDDEHINGSLTVRCPGDSWFINLKNKTGVISRTFTLSQDTTDMIGLFGNTTATVYIKSIKLEPGHIATPFIPPNKEVEKLKCGIVECDVTMLPKTLSTSILEKALELPIGVYHYFMGGNNYTGTDLPHSGYKYGTATINKRNTEAIGVILWGSEGSALVPVQTFYNRNTATFDDWVAFNDGGDATTLDGYHADNLPYVPLDGSVAMSGDLVIKKDTPIIKLTNPYDSYGYVKFQNDNNLAFGVIDTEGISTHISFKPDRGLAYALRIYQNDGSHNDVLHTGNSKATHISNTAPTDTSALWYDTTNKVCKYYKDGAWQQ